MIGLLRVALSASRSRGTRSYVAPPTHTRTKTGANVRVVLRQQPGALHHDSQTGEGIAASMNPHDAHHHHHHHYHHQGGGALAYNTAEVIYSGEGGGR